MTSKTLMATKIQQNNEPSKFINYKTFKRACESIKAWQFEDYNIHEDWYLLFLDEENQSLLVIEHNNRYWLFVENEAFAPLGKLQEHICEFKEQKEYEAEQEAHAQQDYEFHRDFLFENYGHGKI